MYVREDYQELRVRTGYPVTAKIAAESTGILVSLVLVEPNVYSKGASFRISVPTPNGRRGL
jgi:hypothetical protein